jgi:hypothetical protein
MFGMISRQIVINRKVIRTERLDENYAPLACGPGDSSSAKDRGLNIEQ